MDGFNRASDVPPGEGALDPANPAHARSHEHALSARRLREEVLGAELFSDPAWDILLDVYAAEAKGGKIQISSLAPVNGVPSSTARRWAHKLIELGLLERERDDRDHRLSYIRLSRHGHERIVLFIKRLLAKGPPPPIER
jgi:DNA-binding MarR family transcriptional regulator